MKNKEASGAEEQRLRRMLQAERLSPEGDRLHAIRRSVLARVPVKGAGRTSRRFAWFVTPVAIGALALALIAISLQNRGPGQQPGVVLERISEVAGDDVELAQLVELLAGFASPDGDGTTTSASDPLGLDPLAWNGGEDGAPVL